MINDHNNQLVLKSIKKIERSEYQKNIISEIFMKIEDKNINSNEKIISSIKKGTRFLSNYIASKEINICSSHGDLHEGNILARRKKI